MCGACVRDLGVGRSTTHAAGTPGLRMLSPVDYEALAASGPGPSTSGQ